MIYSCVLSCAKVRASLCNDTSLVTLVLFDSIPDPPVHGCAHTAMAAHYGAAFTIGASKPRSTEQSTECTTGPLALPPVIDAPEGSEAESPDALKAAAEDVECAAENSFAGTPEFGTRRGDELGQSPIMGDSVAAAVRAAVRDEMSVFDARMRRIELMLESIAQHAAPVEVAHPPEHSNEDAGSRARP